MTAALQRRDHRITVKAVRHADKYRVRLFLYEHFLLAAVPGRQIKILRQLFCGLCIDVADCGDFRFRYALKTGDMSRPCDLAGSDQSNPQLLHCFSLPDHSFKISYRS